MDDQTAQATHLFRDTDLVYVDPDARAVVSIVEWSRNGNPRSLTMPEKEAHDGKGERRRGSSGRKHYPWGTYRSMKNVYRLEGKQKKPEPGKTLDQVIDRALQEAFWD
ncbi:MAG: hypothetical protein Greene041619_1074 [Candidatus Peregrinibacteria bacterium Greene0416_19]|nr:MAG: hypothetical protein Greene041619_1074 [Candidatus Peregrinibacteria bacterium Greene0416_19]